MELLFPVLPKEKLVQMPALTLAHMGDCIFELYARTYVAQQGVYLAKKAHKMTTELVCAKAQSKMARAIFPQLTEEEQGYYKRGRNSKPKSPSKSVELGEYLSATGLETLFGALYLQGKQQRTKELFMACMESVGQGES